MGCVEFGTTGEHPFWVAGKGWVPAGALAVGDKLVTSDGREVAVEAVRDAGRIATVYNVEVEGDHTYFVGDESEWGFDLWVHNAGEGYRVLSIAEFAKARFGKWADSPLMHGASNEVGRKWLWANSRSAKAWLEGLAGREGDLLIARVGTKRPILHYPSFSFLHPPEGVAVQVPIRDLLRAVIIRVRGMP